MAAYLDPPLFPQTPLSNLALPLSNPYWWLAKFSVMHMMH